jgi:peptidoglycan/xylan/chitin deacetylase (PgdA/CDA1 family)
MQVFLTVDVEAHRVIDEISGKPQDSLASILALLREVGSKGTFFVDLCEVPTWGQAFMGEVCHRILRAGQDVQLHAHPHHFTNDNGRWQLSDYSAEDQRKVLDFAVAQYTGILGRPPVAFRAGGFGIDQNTFTVLEDLGLKLDCSLMHGWNGCNVKQAMVGAPALVHGIRELPMTPVVTLGTGGRQIRTSSIDFNWLPLFMIKRILRRLRSDGAPAAVILLHSSSMLVRASAKNFVYKKRLERKFSKLLVFLKQESFVTRTVAEALEEDRLWTTPASRAWIYVEVNPFLQYWTLLFQSFVGMGFKPTFRAFVFGHIFLLAVLIVAIAKALV